MSNQGGGFLKQVLYFTGFLGGAVIGMVGMRIIIHKVFYQTPNPQRQQVFHDQNINNPNRGQLDTSPRDNISQLDLRNLNLTDSNNKRY